MVCGCQPPDYGDCHGDIRKITTLNVEGSAEATGLPLERVVANLAAACANLVAANDGDTSMKAAAEGISGVVVKSQEEQRYTLTVAYPANKPDVAVAQDGFRDFAAPDAVEKAAWSYLRTSPKVGLWHQTGTDGSGEVCESYIYRGPDWVVKAADGSEQVIKAGDWLMGIIWSEESWPLVKQGLIGGVSPQGRAKRRQADPAAIAQLRS
jgi:Putative phage serine protease XkdF